MDSKKKKHIVIVGGGFGGIKAALELSKDKRCKVTLVSDKEHFRYYPTLYHTATGGLSAQSSIPLSAIFEGDNVAIAQGTITKLDRKNKTITAQEGTIYHYDILILALGMVTNYFGIKGLDKYSYSIKSVEEAKQFKDHLHDQLAEDGRPDLNYIIVGGGPTGIELAGALPDYLKRIMKAHGIKRRAVHVSLVESSPMLVPRMPKRMSRAIAKRLRHIGVKLYLGKKVEGVTAESLTFDGKPLPTETVVWTAGVSNSPFYKQNGFTLTERGKVHVNEFLEAEPDIYVLGDNNDTEFSGMAQTALHNAAFVAENLKRTMDGKNPETYKPKKPIYVLPAGPRWAAVLWGNRQFYGLFGWTLRNAADLRAFQEFEPWWDAGQQWMTEFGTEEECPICIGKGIR